MAFDWQTPAACDDWHPSWIDSRACHPVPQVGPSLAAGDASASGVPSSDAPQKRRAKALAAVNQQAKASERAARKAAEKGSRTAAPIRRLCKKPAAKLLKRPSGRCQFKRPAAALGGTA